MVGFEARQEGNTYYSKKTPYPSLVGCLGYFRILITYCTLGSLCAMLVMYAKATRSFFKQKSVNQKRAFFWGGYYLLERVGSHPVYGLMKTRIVHTRMWKDSWFSNLSRSSKLVFVYLLTCEDNNICGTFELPDRNIIFDTGITSTELDQAKQDLKEKVIFYQNWVHIVNTDKYNNYVTNPKLEKAYKRELAEVPSKVMEYIYKYDTSIDTSIYTTNNHKSKIINHKEGGVGETKTYSSLKDLTPEVLQVVAEEKGISISEVEKTLQQMKDWLDSKGKTYKNYKAGLRNWINRKIEEGKLKPNNPKDVNKPSLAEMYDKKIQQRKEN